MNVVWIAIGISSVSFPPRGLPVRPFLAAARINSARGCPIRGAAARRQLTRRFSAARYEKRIGETKNAFIWGQPGMHGQSQLGGATPRQIARQTGYRARIR